MGEKKKQDERRYVSTRRYIGMQVIDTKGSMIGSVKDVGVELRQKNLALLVGTKSGVEIDVPLDDIQSIEDVVLLSKTVELPSVPAVPSVTHVPVTPSPPSTAPMGMAICPSCHATVPGHAKFCPKCGGKI